MSAVNHLLNYLNANYFAQSLSAYIYPDIYLYDDKVHKSVYRNFVGFLNIANRCKKCAISAEAYEGAVRKLCTGAELHECRPERLGIDRAQDILAMMAQQRTTNRVILPNASTIRAAKSRTNHTLQT